MVTRFATSPPTDNCPQPKEAQPLSQLDSRLCGLMVRRWLLIGYFPILYYPQLEVPATGASHSSTGSSIIILLLPAATTPAEHQWVGGGTQGITREATTRKQQIGIAVDIADTSVAHFLKLIHPKLQYQIGLSKKVHMIEALRDVQVRVCVWGGEPRDSNRANETNNSADRTPSTTALCALLHLCVVLH
jgi:hypothetical protein